MIRQLKAVYRSRGDSIFVCRAALYQTIRMLQAERGTIYYQAARIVSWLKKTAPDAKGDLVLAAAICLSRKRTQSDKDSPLNSAASLNACFSTLRIHTNIELRRYHTACNLRVIATVDAETGNASASEVLLPDDGPQAASGEPKRGPQASLL